MDRINLSKRIRRRRWVLGLTQAELARRVGVTVDAISKWEHARRAPRATKLARLADALELPAEELVRYYEYEKSDG